LFRSSMSLSRVLKSERRNFIWDSCGWSAILILEM
jgi:hypothetical protein